MFGEVPAQTVETLGALGIWSRELTVVIRAGQVRQRQEEAEEVVEPTETIYVVKSGDSLSAIAAHLWGDMSKADVIFEANRDVVDDPARIEVGMRLRIP